MRRIPWTVGFLFLGLAMTTVRADDVDDALNKVRIALKANDSDTALKASEETVKLAPKNPVAWFLRGEALAHVRKHTDAIAAFEKAHELDPKLMVAINQRGGERFRMGDIKGSLEDFEAYIKVNPKAYDDHWRYGISLYYAGKFADGRKQFKAGEKAFGDDVENAFFHYLCNARDKGVEQARKEILKVAPDKRVPMMKIYDLIQGKVKPEDVLSTVEMAKLEAAAKNEALFYAHLYIGLNYEAEGNAAKCAEHLREAVEKHKISHYMWDVGNVHLKLMKK
jgi:lipoprotein NlpI